MAKSVTSRTRWQLDLVWAQFRSRSEVSHRVAEGLLGPGDVGQHFDDQRLHVCQAHRALILAEPVQSRFSDLLGKGDHLVAVVA